MRHNSFSFVKIGENYSETKTIWKKKYDKKKTEWIISLFQYAKELIYSNFRENTKALVDNDFKDPAQYGGVSGLS
jgi:hypothetical protein